MTFFLALISFLINNKGFLIFQETKPFHISGSVSLKRVLIFQEITFGSRKMKSSEKMS